MRRQPIYKFFLLLNLIAILPSFGWAEDSPHPVKELRIGFVGSLTGFASSFGTAALDGARLAVEELNKEGFRINLSVEDDQSVSRQSVTAYTKLRTVDRIEALVGGTWWANAIARQTETHKIPFLSCETLYDKDFVKANTYFSLAGDLRDWVKVYEPLLRRLKIRTGSTVKFTGGFADTIAEEMQLLFSRDDRRYLGNIEYSDIHMSEAGTIATRLKKKQPEVLYIDAQPASFSSLIKRMSELQISATVLTNSIADDAFKQNLVDPKTLSFPLYFTQRSSFDPAFQKRFKARYKRSPELNSDLGYYSVYLLKEAFRMNGDPVKNIRSGTIEVDGHKFSFDDNNVWAGIEQKVWSVRNGKIALVGNS